MRVDEAGHNKFAIPQSKNFRVDVTFCRKYFLERMRFHIVNYPYYIPRTVYCDQATWEGRIGR